MSRPFPGQPLPLTACALLLCGLTAPGWCGSIGSSVAPDANQIASQLVRAEEVRQRGLPEYSATRRYTLRNKRMSQDAEMVVRITYREGEGKRFEILEMRNADGLYKRAFHKMIETEAEASRKGDPTRTRVSPENYTFRWIGTEMMNGRQCHLLATTPKARSKFLLEGKLWVDAEDFAVVRMEGRPSASVSFWVGKPYIVQEFQKVGDFWLASENRSLADAKFIGRTELTMVSSGYQLGGDRAMIRTVKAE